MTNISTLVRRYIDLWNLADPDRRSDEVTRLWTADGSYFAGTGHAKGHDAIAVAIANAHEEFVAKAGYQFVLGAGPDTMGNSVRFTWHMVEPDRRAVAAIGFDFLILTDAELISVDYQYIDQPPAA